MLYDYQISLQKDYFAIYVAPSKNVAPHTHKNLEIAYIQSGHMRHNVNGNIDILHPGDYFIIDHAMTHSYDSISAEPLIVRNYIFAPRFLERSLSNTHSFHDLLGSYLLRFCYQNLRYDPTGVTFHDDTKQILALLDSISREYQQKNHGYLEYIRCVLTEVLILTARKIGTQAQKPDTSPLVSKMTAYADAHYTEPVRLNMLAEQLGYSVPYLSARFSREMGVSFMAYLHRNRIEYSCRLLESTDAKVLQIAQAVGYESEKYFNQIFKKHLGVTPKEFRKINKN